VFPLIDFYDNSAAEIIMRTTLLFSKNRDQVQRRHPNLEWHDANKQPVSFAVISRCAPGRVVKSGNEKIVNQRVGLQLQFVPDADRSF
jgi:hypothetical protein